LKDCFDHRTTREYHRAVGPRIKLFFLGLGPVAAAA